MTSIPSNLARVPTLLVNQSLLSSMTHTSRGLIEVQSQLASGKLVNRPSDNAVATSAISILDDILEKREQRVRNLSHGSSVLGNVDTALADATELMHEARAIALGQIGVGSDGATRENQAEVIDSILQQMISVANRKYQDVHLFAGNATAREPLTERLGGLRYQGRGDGLHTDLGLNSAVNVTMSATSAFGAMSSRVQGDLDLQPRMASSTLVTDLGGAAGDGVELGAIVVNVNGTELVVDLTDASTVGDVVATLQDAIQTIDPAATVGIDAASGSAFEVIPGGGSVINIADLGIESTASDLGLVTTISGPAGGIGNDINPLLTPLTEVSNLAGVVGPLGTIRITNAGQSRELDLSSAVTIQDLMNMVEALDIGVRVEVDQVGGKLNFVNELSGGDMSVSEVGGGDTATRLGVRSLAATTLLADFNDGAGVQWITDAVDPVTGLPDPARNVDFRISLKNGVNIDVNLTVEQTVKDLLDTINAAAATAGVAFGVEFEARLAQDGNGIELVDNSSGVNAQTTVTRMNGSNAAQDLGILGSTSGAILTGEDRATVAVDSVFTHLMTLRNALRANDDRGISLASQRMEADLDRLTQARARAGVSVQRIENARSREEDLRIQDMSLKSQVQDLDFTEAALRLATLQRQLQAGLATAAQVTSLSLLDFLR
jgi:flagellar hook-associated protein 3 FlgL